MKKPQNIKIKLIALAVSFTIIPMSYAGLFDLVKQKPNTDKFKPTVSEDIRGIPPEKWQDTESGRFAHALQYEDKLAKPVPYNFTKGKDFITEGVDYFEHLCKTEGKDYIYSKAKDVDTVAQLRSFEVPLVSLSDPNYGPQYYRFSIFALESPLFFNENVANTIAGKLAPYGNKKLDEVSHDIIRSFYGGFYMNYQIKFNNNEMFSYKKDYGMLEQMHVKGLVVTDLDRKKAESVQQLDKITARYGFTWKGFNRPKDRDYGIAGGDLIIIDLEKNEIMAIQRSFIKAKIQINSPTNVNWDGIGCFEQYKNDDLYKNRNFENKSFIEKVKLVHNSSPNTSSSPAFLKNVLVPRDYRKTAQEGK
jgi:hypothetical protein